METIAFECEIITPMFLAGADGHTPELRPPSIKGAMRFWWRAMKGHLPIKKLKEEEAKIFGASDEKIGRSKVVIKIKNTPTYDGYSCLPIPHKNFRLPAYKTSTAFSVLLSIKNDIRLFDDIYFRADNLKNLFILFSSLGGLGKRVRRGSGSFMISKINNSPYNFEHSLKNILTLVNDVSNNKYKLEDNRILLRQNINAQYPFLKEIQIGKEYDSWEKLVKKVSELSHKYNIDSLGFARGNKRFASPVYVSALKKSNNKYLPIISTLNTVFENSNKSIDYEKQGEFKNNVLMYE